MINITFGYAKTYVHH